MRRWWLIGASLLSCARAEPSDDAHAPAPQPVATMTASLAIVPMTFRMEGAFPSSFPTFEIRADGTVVGSDSPLARFRFVGSELRDWGGTTRAAVAADGSVALPEAEQLADGGRADLSLGRFDERDRFGAVGGGGVLIDDQGVVELVMTPPETKRLGRFEPMDPRGRRAATLLVLVSMYYPYLFFAPPQPAATVAPAEPR